jgi:hypothetical protein
MLRGVETEVLLWTTNAASTSAFFFVPLLPA